MVEAVAAMCTYRCVSSGEGQSRRSMGNVAERPKQDTGLDKTWHKAVRRPMEPPHNRHCLFKLSLTKP